MPDDDLQRRLSRLEAPDLAEDAYRIAGFDLRRRRTYGTASNISGLRNDKRTFSRRQDSLTIFATDSRYGYLGELGAWTGPDRTAIAAGRRILRAAKIPTAEVDNIGVVEEHGAVGELLSDTEVRVEQPKLLRKLVRARRAVNGVPVWSSHLLLGLTHNGEVGYLELHWPRLAQEVIKEAEFLQAIVKRGFKPRSMPGASIESVEAGVIHSPAIGFFMDVRSAIRVVYAGDDPTVGRKPSVHLDRHGELVDLPRSIYSAPSEETNRASPTGQAG